MEDDEPYRPIPSGKIKPWEVYSQMGFLLVGAILIAWAVFEVARFLYAQTFLGLWLSVAGAAVLLLAGLLTWRRHRKDAKVKKVVDAQLKKRAKKG